jgi:histidine triad (HIT) family protein
LGKRFADKLIHDESCVFCKIVNKQAPASLVYEDDIVIAFLDIRPLSEGHTLVIPKAHYVDIFDIAQKELEAIYDAVKKLAVAIKEATKADGISIIQQNGKAAGQDIFHLHVHVVPRVEGVKLQSFHELIVVERIDLDKMAQKIRCSL